MFLLIFTEGESMMCFYFQCIFKIKVPLTNFMENGLAQFRQYIDGISKLHILIFDVT